MIDSIDDVVQSLTTDYGLNFQQYHPELATFGTWFLEEKKYDLNPRERPRSGHSYYFWVTADAMIFYSYLTGKIPLKTDLQHQTFATIESLEQVYLLRSKGTERSFWPDSRLYQLYTRREGSNDGSAIKYKELFDVVASYPLLIERFGKQMKYAADVLIRKKKQ